MKTNLRMLFIVLGMIVTVSVSGQTYYGSNYMMKRLQGNTFLYVSNVDMYEVVVSNMPTVISLPNGMNVGVRRSVPNKYGGWYIQTTNGMFGMVSTSGDVDWDKRFQGDVYGRPQRYRGGDQGYGNGGGVYSNGGVYSDGNSVNVTVGGKIGKVLGGIVNVNVSKRGVQVDSNVGVGSKNGGVSVSTSKGFSFNNDGTVSIR